MLLFQAQVFFNKCIIAAFNLGEALVLCARHGGFTTLQFLQVTRLSIPDRLGSMLLKCFLDSRDSPFSASRTRMTHARRAQAVKSYISRRYNILQTLLDTFHVSKPKILTFDVI